VQAILERKYGDICSPAYIKKIVRSIVDDPIRLRTPRYITVKSIQQVDRISERLKIILVINDRHDIHHVRDRGYVESPVRIKTIVAEINQTNLFKLIKTKTFGEKYITAVHAPDFVSYLKKVSQNVPSNKSIYPYVFPIRNATRPPKELPIRAGYYCIDTFTPINHNAYLAAKRAVDCTLTAATKIADGQEIAYALVRPPGHHAEYRSFGGFCYFNAAAVAANYLARLATVAILDIDYHHGNGQQNIFYKRKDVLTISIHGHPRFAYPYFSGFRDETGSGEAIGYNINFPLPETVDGEKYRGTLQLALQKIQKFKPGFLIIALGLDTAKGDPTGTWRLSPRDFQLNGEMIGAAGLPMLVVQEGGYKIRSLGVNARHFFQGLWKGFYGGPNF
jgi:acetoin utilization deacetylase AcuC-like enzyme